MSKVIKAEPDQYKTTNHYTTSNLGKVIFASKSSTTILRLRHVNNLVISQYLVDNIIPCMKYSALSNTCH